MEASRWSNQTEKKLLDEGEDDRRKVSETYQVNESLP
jgi:hypothetical protein